MRDWKTTVTALVTGILSILAYFGIILPEGWIPIIISVGVIILGLLMPDKPKE